MFQRFRKHQRLLFGVVTILAICSILFFGIYSPDLVPPPEAIPDRPVGKAIDGSPISSRECKDLVRLIASDMQNFSLEGPNLLNPAILQKELLEPGIGELLATAYFSRLQSSLQEKLHRVHNYHLYVHPQNPSISLLKLWERYQPHLAQAFKDLKQEESATPHTFSLLVRLYQEAGKAPPELMRRLLLYYEAESRTPHDPSLNHRDLSLFGFHSLSDWFSQPFLELTAEWILNAAIAAEEQGWAVSLVEAKADLRHNFSTVWNRLSEEERKNISYEQSLHALGMDEERAAHLWTKVLLSRALLQTTARATFLDPLAEEALNTYAEEGLRLDTYRWPKEFSLRTMEDLALFQTYLHAIAKTSSLLTLPEELRPMAEIEKLHPELFQTSYRVELAQIDNESLWEGFGAKQLLLWQLDPMHWEMMRTQFSALPIALERNARMHVLETLAPSLKQEVDAYSRTLVANERALLLHAALHEAPYQETIVTVSLQSSSLADIANTKSFASLLERACRGEEEAQHALSSYAGQKALYAIRNVTPFEPTRLMTFKEVKESSTLSKSLPRKEEAARTLFMPLLIAIDRQQQETRWTEGQGPFSFYASHRLVVPTEQELIARQSGATPSTLFSMECEEQIVLRKKVPALFALPCGSWSSIESSPLGTLQFSHIKEKVPPAHLLPRTEARDDLLTHDAARHIAGQLLQRMQQTSP